MLARDATGKTQKQLASDVGVSQARVSNLEDGLPVAVEAPFLEKISGALEVTPSFLIDADPIRLITPHYRKRKNIAKKYTKSIEGRLTLVAEAMRRLNREIENENDLLPEIDPEEVGGAREVARLLRRRWCMPSGPVVSFFKLVERAGVFLIPFEFESKLIDGVAFWADHNTPLIFYNRAFSADRIRLNIAHELGHLVMHRAHGNDQSQEREDQAFEFAIEFLVPSQEVRRYYFPLNLEKLASLKIRWKVSMQALLRQARDIGAIKESYYRYLCMQIGRSGYRTQEPHEDRIPAETPTLVQEVIDVFRNEWGFSDSDLSRATGLGLERLNRELVSVGDNLRVL